MCVYIKTDCICLKEKIYFVYSYETNTYQGKNLDSGQKDTLELSRLI